MLQPRRSPMNFFRFPLERRPCAMCVNELKRVTLGIVSGRVTAARTALLSLVVSSDLIDKDPALIGRLESNTY